MNKDDEIFIDVTGFEGLYKVSNHGNVFSVRLGRHLKGFIHPKGYIYYKLQKKGEKRDIRGHRLVAEAFLENTLNLLQVNHKNLDKLDNHVDNLEWCDQQQNMSHAVKNGAMKGNAGESNP